MLTRNRSLWFMWILLGCTNTQASIEFRKAHKGDLPGLFQVDREVTDEYFKPLYRNAYSHLCIGQDPDFYLDKELKEDIAWFEECISLESNYSLYVAVDGIPQDVAGFIISHKEDKTTLLIDLLLVCKKYRNKGIGKELVRSTIGVFKDVQTCVVYPFGCSENQTTLNFYRSVGFKDLGPADVDKEAYGIPYIDLYRYLRLDL